MARAMVAAGARPGDLLHVAFGYGLFTGGLGFHDGAERLGLTVVPVSSGNTARQHLLLQDFRPAGIAATPSFALYIAESLREHEGHPERLGLRYGMFGAEPWTEGMRTALERAWGFPAYDIYGLSEIIGPGVSGECEARDGLHIADDHFLPEIVDPATRGAPAAGPRGRAGHHDRDQASDPTCAIPYRVTSPPSIPNPVAAAARAHGWPGSRAGATTC